MNNLNILASVGFFIFGVLNAIKPNFGFVALSDAESVGRNVYTTLIYTGCIWAIREVVFMVKAKQVQSTGAAEPARTPTKKENQMRLIMIFVVAAVIFGLGTQYVTMREKQNGNQQQAEVIETQDKAKYTEVAKKVLSHYAEKNKEAYPNATALLESNVLEPESFASISALTNIITLITNALPEIDDSENTIEDIIEEGEKIIQDSDLSSKDKETMIAEFNEVFLGDKTVDLRKKSDAAMEAYYEKMLTLYQFMMVMYTDYEINTDANGLFSPAFYTDSNIEEYNQLSTDLQNAVQVFQEAYAASQAHATNELKKLGVDITTEEVEKLLSGDVI